jgi:hypothetical protein
MTLKIKLMLWLGAVFAAFTCAVVFTPLTQTPLWGPVVIASTVFAFLAVAFGTARWAAISIPGFVLTAIGFSYFRLHAGDPSGIAALVATLIPNVVIGWMRLRRSRANLNA